MRASRACAAELSLDVLLRYGGLVRYQPIIRQPAIYQDIAVVVGEDVPAERVRAVIASNGGPLFEHVDLFDVYTGTPIPEGQRSLAFRMTFRAPDRTLQDAEVSKVREKIARRLEQELRATIRS